MEQDWTEDAAWWTAVLTGEPPSAIKSKKNMNFWIALSDRIQSNTSENGRLSFLRSLRTNFSVPLRSQFPSSPPCNTNFKDSHLWTSLPGENWTLDWTAKGGTELQPLLRAGGRTAYFLFDDLRTTLAEMPNPEMMH
ncbi:hypothetical protein BV898_05247 [Hypsibius exemplaris]|uniref:Uncharacterized protein n=1 Tax=Hypsibius exemplaris TaxID=2072580 RepID=A0A1W0WZP0_HYPEX|nr:hypothetical protein BV898_05247 [Hypsibius exemplaris]